MKKLNSNQLLPLLNARELATLIAQYRIRENEEGVNYDNERQNILASLSHSATNEYNFLIQLINDTHQHLDHDLYDFYLLLALEEKRLELFNLMPYLDGPITYHNNHLPFFKNIQTNITKLNSDIQSYIRTIEIIEETYFNGTNIISRKTWYATKYLNLLKAISSRHNTKVTNIHNKIKNLKLPNLSFDKNLFLLNCPIQEDRKLVKKLLSIMLDIAKTASGFNPNVLPKEIENV